MWVGRGLLHVLVAASHYTAERTCKCGRAGAGVCRAPLLLYVIMLIVYLHQVVGHLCAVLGVVTGGNKV